MDSRLFIIPAIVALCYLVTGANSKPMVGGFHAGAAPSWKKLQKVLAAISDKSSVSQRGAGEPGLPQWNKYIPKGVSDIEADTGSMDILDGLQLEKRQGLWDYDYGLGGGRFGKRGDYGIGGGRWGRDVDHVLNDGASS